MQQSAVARPRELRLNPDLAWLVAGEPRETVRDCPIYLPWQSFSLPKAFKPAPKVPRTEPRRYFARYSDGCHPVEDFGTRVKVHWPTGPVEYGSQRAALAALTGHPTARNWTWDRYFRLGRRQTASAQSFDLLQVTVFDLMTSFPGADRLTTATGDVQIVSPKLGIDLAKRGHEVKKLLFAGFGGQIHASGYDPDDVLQEVFKGLLVRNNGKCPFDPRKASFGHYVHLVCSCIVKNFHRRMVRQRAVEPTADEADELAMEMAEGTHWAESDDSAAEDFAESLRPDSPFLGASSETLATRVLPFVRQGYSRAEIADALDLPKPAISKALAEIRQSAREWAR